MHPLAVRVLLVIALLAAFAVIPSQQDASASTDRKTSVGSRAVGNEVSVAPEAELINGVDDIDESGNCMDEVKKLCPDVEAGESKLADCISDAITESEISNEDDAPVISDQCREDVFQYKILRSSNINFNVALAKACKVDAEKLCNNTWLFGYKAGQVIGCLKDAKERVAPACKKQLFKVQLDAAHDFRADAPLYAACKVDAEKLCKDVKFGGGRVQACLRDQRIGLSWGCEEELFRQEMENADDIRLSVRLFSKCLGDKRKFCPDVLPGNAQVKECLESHRTKPGFSSDCREEVDAMIERRVRDFKLDSRLRTSCQEDIATTCSFYGDSDELQSEGADSIIRCLQDYVNEIKDQKCKEQVKKYQELAAEDIRFDVPLAEACYDDRVKYCQSVPPGSARVIRCLMKQRNKLDPTCRAVLFDEEVRFSQNLDFQFPMRQSCETEIKIFCKDIPAGEARVIRCLQDNKSHKDFGKDCKDKVKEYELESASDYRFNYRLAKACKADIDTLCSDVCHAEQGQVCGGTVLRCLTQNRKALQSEACQAEVFYFEKMGVSDYRNDLILAAACRDDVEKHCKNVEPGDGRVHECLRSHRDKLSESCRKEELLLEEEEAENLELRPGIMRMCKEERSTFCKGVAPGQARLFRCLAEKMGDPDFGENCRHEIIEKLQRRQANWKLDPPLRKACKEAVQQLCDSEDHANGEAGAVYMCLMRQYMDLDDGCQKELGRAVHMALFAWMPSAILTSVCDDDIQSQCLSRRPNMAKTPGAVGSCLASILDEMPPPSGSAASAGGGGSQQQRTLSDKCRTLVDVAEPPNMKRAFEASLSVVVLKSQLEALESKTGVQMLNRDRRGNAQSVTLTGWTALAGIAAMLLLVMWGFAYAWRQYKGESKDGYTLVVKRSHQGRQ